MQRDICKSIGTRFPVVRCLVPDTVDVKMETENELPSDSSSQDDTWMLVDGEYTGGGGGGV
jgi:hypothetical protein